MRYFLIMVVGFVLNSHSTFSQRNFKSKLETLNQQLIEAALTKKFQRAERLYSDSTILMAEYQPVLDGKRQIMAYYSEMFSRQDLKTYNRQTMEITDFGNLILEIGLFQKEFADGNKLKGKYFNSWSVNENGDFSLRAECFGFFGEPENKQDYRVMDLLDENEPLKGRKGKKIPKEIQAYNAFGENLVRDRNTQGVVDAYTKDGVYFPFADTAKTGYQELLTHFTQYHSHPVKIDSIEVWAHDYDWVPGGLVKYNKFWVKWTVPDGYTGVSSGAGISYWKKIGDEYLRHRQVATHIHQP